MARIVIVGGIESTYRNAQVLFELGEEIVLFVTRGARCPGWEGVDMVDGSNFPFVNRVRKLEVQGHINDHIEDIRVLRPDFIFSLGWQQVYSKALLGICPVVGIHESLLPEGAGAVPIANAILHDRPLTGVTLFWLDGGIDTGAIIGQLTGTLSPREANATDLYKEGMALSAELLKMYMGPLNKGTAPRISQDFSKRTVYQKVDWSKWPKDRVARARVYPYV